MLASKFILLVFSTFCYKWLKEISSEKPLAADIYCESVKINYSQLMHNQNKVTEWNSLIEGKTLRLHFLENHSTSL